MSEECGVAVPLMLDMNQAQALYKLVDWDIEQDRAVTHHASETLVAIRERLDDVICTLRDGKKEKE